MTDRGIYPADLAAACVEDAGQKYRPSNGTEGEYFASAYCYNCTKDSENHPCEIAGNALFHDIDEEGYPIEWQYGPDGQPTCTAFEESTP